MISIETLAFLLDKKKRIAVNLRVIARSTLDFHQELDQDLDGNRLGCRIHTCCYLIVIII